MHILPPPPPPHSTTRTTTAPPSNPILASLPTGSTEKVCDGETLVYDNYELSPSDPWVNGQAPVITVTGSITQAGSAPNSCMIEWNDINPNNYETESGLPLICS